MRFEGRDLPVGAEHVAARELRVHETYFIVAFNDGSMLIPSLRPVVFVGRNLLNGDLDKLYFQDYESFSAGRRQDLPQEAEGGRLDVFFESQGSGVYEYERALDTLMRCSLERQAQASTNPQRCASGSG